MITIIAKCRTHPTYKAILRPRCKCKGCWSLFIFVNAVRAAPVHLGGYSYDAIGALDGERMDLRVKR